MYCNTLACVSSHFRCVYLFGDIPEGFLRLRLLISVCVCVYASLCTKMLMQTIRGRRSHVSIRARVCTSREYSLHPAFLPSQVYLFVSNPPSTTPLSSSFPLYCFLSESRHLIPSVPLPRLRICFYVIFKYNLYLLSTFTFTFTFSGFFF